MALRVTGGAIRTGKRWGLPAVIETRINCHSVESSLERIKADSIDKATGWLSVVTQVQFDEVSATQCC